MRVKKRDFLRLREPMLDLLLIFALLWRVINCAVLPAEVHFPISLGLFQNLSTYAHLIDISYCISPVSKIHPPFECENNCQDFPDTELVFQWDTGSFMVSDRRFATSGYIAVNHNWKKVLVVLRGTRSFKDSIVDFDAEMEGYFAPGCIGCKVHKGFHASSILTWEIIKQSLGETILEYPKYEVQLMGHSLGGAVSVLIGVKVSRIFKDHVVKCLTMGQPMVGNNLFGLYVDDVFDLENVVLEQRKLIRVTHLDDPVVKLPFADSIVFGDLYSHSSSEIFINEAGNPVPSIINVIHCHGRSDTQCAAGMKYTRDNTNHLNYFRRMGKCGFGF